MPARLPVPALALAIAMALALCGAAPAHAQDEIVFDPAPLEACWAEHARSISCSGEGSGPCMQATPFGASTRGMTACLAAELGWWQALLARLLDELRAAEAAFDAAPDGPGVHDPPSALAALERTQARWDDWAEARCDYEMIELLGSTLLGPVSVGCRLELTLRQVDFLAGRLRGHVNR